MTFEDLHWADPSSRELLDLAIDQIEDMPVLLIATFRPEFQASWVDRPHVTSLSLRRLGRHESQRLVQELVGDAATLSSGVMDEIVERTDGVPLFLEELTKAVLENTAVGTIPVTSSAVPAALHASLMARLDRLGPMAKGIAQIGAAIGREFPMSYWPRPRREPTRSCTMGFAGWLTRGWYFSAAFRQRLLSCSSTHWCRTPPTACCCAARARHCTRVSQRRSKPGRAN
jgi:hypothetical protein